MQINTFHIHQVPLLRIIVRVHIVIIKLLIFYVRPLLRVNESNKIV